MFTYLKSDVRLLVAKAAVILSYATTENDIKMHLNDSDLISPNLVKELLEPALGKPNKK